MLNPADVKKISSQLKPLTFVIEKDKKNIDDCLVQQYLDHFKINFSKSLSNVKHGFGKFDACDFTIAAHYWIPEVPRGTIFVLHGYYDHVGLFNNIIRFSLQNDYAVVAFDFPGMGLSSGDRASIETFDDYRRVLDKAISLFNGVMPKPWYCVAQSTGATAVAGHLVEAYTSPFKKVVLLAPLIRSKGWTRDRWTYFLVHWFLKSIPRTFTTNSHDNEFLSFLRKEDPMQYRRLPIRWIGAMKEWISRFKHFDPQDYPLLVIQGDEDGTVDYLYNLEQIKTVFPNAEIKMIPSARHHLVCESAPYRAQVFAAIKSYLERPGDD
ncbi:MAG: alpha/beta hydrolase [Cellvibrionaceae bacterium]